MKSWKLSVPGKLLGIAYIKYSLTYFLIDGLVCLFCVSNEASASCFYNYLLFLVRYSLSLYTHATFGIICSLSYGEDSLAQSGVISLSLCSREIGVWRLERHYPPSDQSVYGEIGRVRSFFLVLCPYGRHSKTERSVLREASFIYPQQNRYILKVAKALQTTWNECVSSEHF